MIWTPDEYTLEDLVVVLGEKVFFLLELTSYLRSLFGFLESY